MATTPDYSVNYDDERFTKVTTDKNAALTEVEQTYGGMIKDSDKFYDKQIDAAKDYATEQARIQQEQTDFAIEQINQQKEQAKQDYTKEQSGAYVDWQKQSNQYGANAEQTAAQGMTNTGYSESSQVSMYNTYQNRVATAREAYTRAVLNYDNMIKEARLKNSAALAEIAYNSLQKQLELSLAGFQYKNELVLAKASEKRTVDEMYHNRWQDVLNQINTENTLAENVRQFGIQQELREKEYEEGVRQFNAELALKQSQLAEEKRQFNALHSSDGTKPRGVVGNSPSGSEKSTPSKRTRVQNGGKDYVKENAQKKASAEPDMKSIMALGYGPMSAAELDKKIRSGQVEEYYSDGKLKYRHSASYVKQKMLHNYVK